jgi:hypothetical protein
MCPNIHLESGDSQQASLEFRFRKDENTSQSSTFTYWQDGNKKVVTLYNWSASWVCDIKTSQIQNVMETLIQPSKQSLDVNPAVLQPNMQISLEQIAVKSKDFMLSSLFCVLESQTLDSSLLVHDRDGKDAPAEVYKALKELLMHHVDEVAKQAPAGVPTIQNPFVLGYGVVQQPASVAAAGNPTPPAFIPREFDLSVTPPKDA